MPENKVPKIDPEFLNPFIAATKMTLETQANTALTPEKAYVKKDKTLESTTEIAGIINLTCEQFQGSIALCFPAKVFLKIYENMVDEVIDTIDEDVADCAGELLNIIFGNAKTTLMAKGYKLERAIPTVLIGEKLQVQFRSPYPAIVLPFRTEAGSFDVEILVEHGD
ncbi:MAG: chemotaxis protein CheX [Bdellovibrionaceae bacterium]|jgi:chemotaxis protein CheX|nr:chemotaxis protein CheX [Pseudobdellovibrionaceae bacterium]